LTVGELRPQRRVKTIAGDGATDRSHVESELVLLAAVRAELERTPPCSLARFSVIRYELDPGLCVRRSRRHFSHPKEWFAGLDTARHTPLIRHQFTIESSHCRVTPLDLATGEQSAIVTALGRDSRQQHESRRVPVQPMHRGEVAQSEQALHLVQNTALDEWPRGCHWEEVGLVDDDQMLVDLDDLDLGAGRLVGHFPVVADPESRLAGRLGREWTAAGIDDKAAA
jgi:hypothetical protein